MGQRLNVEIVVKSRTIANVYMHWSAYTSSSLMVTNDIIKAFKNIKEEDLENIEEIYKRIQEALPNSSINEIERIELEKQGITNLKKVKNVDRNDGLISFSKKGIKETRDWEEGRTTIDIENKCVMFDVYYTVDKNDEDYAKIHKEKIDYQLFENWIPYDEFNELSKKLIDKINDGIYYFETPQNLIVMIE